MLYYLGTYRTEAISHRQAYGSMAEDAKMAYIASALKRLHLKIKIISVVSSQTFGFHRRFSQVVDDKETVVFLESFDCNKALISKFSALQRLVSLFLFLLFNLRKDDTLLVYNTQLFSLPVRMAKSIKGFKMVLEVEELFYMDSQRPADIRRRALEEKLIRAADGYIFASMLLAKHLASDKPCAVVYGGYSIPKKLADRFSDGNIHVVYAGGIDSLRRVDIAVAAFMLLPENYRLHILGQGSPQDLSKLGDCIQKTNSFAGFEKVRYDGCLYGREYDRFLQSCHIGLNMQAIGSSIEAFAYPSKISSYLSRGLNVVSGKLVSIVNSPFAEGISFFQDNTPEAVAKAIVECPPRSYEHQVQLVMNAEKAFFRELESFDLR